MGVDLIKMRPVGIHAPEHQLAADVALISKEHLFESVHDGADPRLGLGVQPVQFHLSFHQFCRLGKIL